MKKIIKGFLVACLLSAIIAPVAVVIGGVVTKSIDAENTFSDAFNPIDWSPASGPTRTTGYFNISTGDTDIGTVTLQRSYDAGSNWLDISSYTSITETSLTDSEGTTTYRIGVKTGDYTSGTSTMRLGN